MEPQSQGRPVETQSTVKLVTFDFHIPQLDRNRRIWVCLPIDYYTSDKTYPVIYMHDAQNLFDPTQNEFGFEWQVDESLSTLQEYGDFGVIVVAIDHAGKERINEFSPWKNPKHGGGDGERYVNFIVNTLKPFIDYYFRTKPGREYTGMIGSSLGGFVTLYAGIQHQDIFSKLGIYSPSFWFSKEIFKLVEEKGKQYDMRIYIMGGEKESENMRKHMEMMEKTLIDSGFDKDEMKVLIKPEVEHSEYFWSIEFPETYLWLFENLDVNMDESHYKLLVFPTPAQDYIHVAMSSYIKSGVIDIFDQSGKIRLTKPFVPRVPINVKSLAPGKYQLRLSRNGKHWFKVLEKI